MNKSVNHLVTRQAGESVAVSGPGGIGAGGDAGIVVQVYALGAGVALEGDGGDLARTEGAFELEAHGKVLVIDPLRAAEAHWLVAPVKCHITAIGHQVEAVNQKELAKFGFGRSHGQVPPEKTAILSLPQGMGKSTIARAMAQRIGCSRVIDEWHPLMPLLPGALHLTNVAVAT